MKFNQKKNNDIPNSFDKNLRDAYFKSFSFK